MSTNPYGGYTCSRCGTWVGWGVYHGCVGKSSYQQPTTDTTIALALGRIEALLEQILAKLDATGASS